ncbi:MAG: serine/threonine-protein kinase [Myxococcota bacterium]|nr:serine/threonine-protein kinase [Myxococcota bacterium]
MREDTPAQIGDYLPERLLGRGAMAEVYLCRAPGGEAVAVKWLTTTHPPLVRRFEREISVLARLDHPSLVTFIDHGMQEARPFLVMEYVEGLDLRLYAKKLRTRPLVERYARVRTIGRALAEGLEHLHSSKLVHRDIKPSNVLVEESGRVVLTDLGVVKDLQEAEGTAVGLMIGTVAYAAPEQIDGERVDARADLYGLGATLYYLLTLQRPFDGRDRLPDARPLPPSHFDPSLPTDLEAIILRLMEPEPSARYPEARAVVQALAAGRVDGVAVAGRQRALEQVAAALDRVEAGESLFLRAQGPLGVGKAWLTGVARQAARRRGLPVIDTASAVVEEGSAALWLGGPGADVPAGVTEVCVSLAPLSLADVRRTVVGAAPMTEDAAQVSAALHHLTGGIPALLVPMISRHVSGGRLRLPDSPSLPAVVEDYLEGLDIDEREVLEVLATSRAPLSLPEVEAVVHTPPELALETLRDRGLARPVGERWTVGADLFRTAALADCADPEGLMERLAAVRAHQLVAKADGDLERLARNAIEEAGRGALAGGLSEAIDALEWAASHYQAVGDRESECRALCELGLVLVDAGLFGRARRRMADASALARAGSLETLRRRAHVLRATAELGERPDSRVAAASAIDRLMPVVTGASGRSADVSDALGFATWARAAARLGDRATWRRARRESGSRVDDLPLGDRLRVVVALARADAAGGDKAGARKRLDGCRGCASGYPLIAWHRAHLEAASGDAPAPSPGELGQGSLDVCESLRAFPEYVR